MKTDISVIICTYNRCESLKTTLDSLIGQEVNDSCRYEIVVVDNRSTDQTKAVVGSYASQFDGKLRYAYESKAGLSHARNKGVQEAKGRVIAFTDDDCIVDRNWLQTVYTCAKKLDFDALGGRILPTYPSKTPNWIRANADIIRGPVLCHDYGTETKRYASPMTPIFGANMAFKREVFDQFGLFRTDLGAGKGTMGEDTELYYRLATRSAKIYYCGAALVWHPAVKERMTLGYIARWNMEYGKFHVVRHDGMLKKHYVVYRGVPRYLFRRILEKSVRLMFSIFHFRSFLKNWISLFRDIGTTQAYRQYHTARVKGVA